jgi:hypothetical protein
VNELSFERFVNSKPLIIPALFIPYLFEYYFKPLYFSPKINIIENLAVIAS